MNVQIIGRKFNNFSGYGEIYHVVFVLVRGDLNKHTVNITGDRIPQTT